MEMRIQRISHSETENINIHTVSHCETKDGTDMQELEVTSMYCSYIIIQYLTQVRLLLLTESFPANSTVLNCTCHISLFIRDCGYNMNKQ